ncbi:hypothetical protein QYE76_017723 [Lolium multiflorum]|uniref:Uncharacterized protein n=1 Tax=Lolium multiflorum TaxID=4521 RepID=A0AAD8UZ56_LOLMU|nr:hypothetical protein QYE76_017723 [Lolium multiflorum]
MAGTPVTYDELPEEHKKKYDEIKAVFKADLISAFERTRRPGIRWKGFSPEGILDEVDLSTPSEERTRALRQEINYMVAHSLHRHSESLVNAFERVAVRVVQEIMKHQYSPSGPALGTHQGEIPFQTRPQLPFALAAHEPPGSPASLSTRLEAILAITSSCKPPKESHMDTCAHTCRTATTCAHTNQITTGGISGADADKQAWLAKYATGTSHESSAPAANTVEQISTILRDQFGILPKRRTVGYSKPYPNDYDLIPLPPKYRLPEFSKFNGSEGSSSIEHNRRAEPSRVEDFEESEDEEEDRYHRPRWCPDGLSHSQKRRVQRLRSLEEAEAQYLHTLRKARPDLAVKIQQTLDAETRPQKKEWRPKQVKADAKSSAGTNMVFILPSEFCAPIIEEAPVAQFDCGPRPVIFEKPRERSYKHLKALYLKGYINGQPVGKMLVDTGAGSQHNAILHATPFGTL